VGVGEVVGVAVGEAAGVEVAVAVGVGAGVSVGAAVGAWATPMMNWPPASIWKCTDCRLVREVWALVRIWRGSVRAADAQPAMKATMARTPAAVIASDFRRNT
jgi:hypothetical protein